MDQISANVDDIIFTPFVKKIYSTRTLRLKIAEI